MMVTLLRCDWPGCGSIENIETVIHCIAAMPLAQIDLCPDHKESLCALQVHMKILKDGVIHKAITGGAA